MADEQTTPTDDAGILARVRELLGGSSGAADEQEPQGQAQGDAQAEPPAASGDSPQADEAPSEEGIPQPATAEQLMGVLRTMGLTDENLRQLLDESAAKQQAEQEPPDPSATVSPDVLGQIKDLLEASPEPSEEEERATIGAGSMNSAPSTEAATPGMAWRKSIAQKSYV